MCRPARAIPVRGRDAVGELWRGCPVGEVDVRLRLPDGIGAWLGAKVRGDVEVDVAAAVGELLALGGRGVCCERPCGREALFAHRGGYAPGRSGRSAVRRGGHCGCGGAGGGGDGCWPLFGRDGASVKSNEATMQNGKMTRLSGTALDDGAGSKDGEARDSCG